MTTLRRLRNEPWPFARGLDLDRIGVAGFADQRHVTFNEGALGLERALVQSALTAIEYAIEERAHLVGVASREIALEHKKAPIGLQSIRAWRRRGRLSLLPSHRGLRCACEWNDLGGLVRGQRAAIVGP